MKKLFMALALMVTLASMFTVSSCRETTGDKIEDAADDVEDAVD